MKRLLALLFAFGTVAPALGGDWFDEMKAAATPQQLYTFLYALPKGGDLHNHLPGGDRSEWLFDSVLAQQPRGYVYYTRTRIDNCGSPLLLFKNIQESTWRTLDACQQGEFERIQDLDARKKAAWLDSQRLEAAWEGRDEFFNAHFDRVNDLLLNPWIIRDILITNMQAFAREGVVYLELMQFVDRMVNADGSPMPTDDVVKIFREALASPAARATGVTVRFQDTVLRFAPDAEELVRRSYAIVDRYRDLYVGLNLVGREDNDKGYPLRFLPVMREMRHKYPEVHLSIHAGEVDEPNHHIRDTLLLGADRIGHGVNLISDPDTLIRMRNGPYLVEINLVSNLLLEYVGDYSQHPFAEYLRTGVPVALSTDDRGMWDSNMTDEYYVAVKEFNLSWNELVRLGRNSLQYSFLDAVTKARLLADYERRLAAFEANFRKRGWKALDGVKPETYGFICRRYRICLQ